MIKAETCYGVIRIGEEWINSVLNFDEFGRPVVTMFYSILHEPSKLVLGRFNGIGNVTFYKNRYFSSEAGSGAGITKFYSAMLVQGAYSQENQLSFNACSIDISPYFSWFDKSSALPFNRSELLNIENIEISSFEIEEIECSIKVSKNSKFSTEEGVKNFHYEIKTHLFFESDEQLGLIKIELLKGYIESFFSFMSSKRYVFRIYCFENLPYNEGGPSFTYESLNQFAYKQLTFRQVPFHDIEERFQDIIKSWVESPDLVSIANRMMSRFNQNRIDYQDGFLNMSIAIENYYSLHKGEKDDRSAYIKKLEKLNAIAPEKLKFTTEELVSIKDTRDFHVHSKEKKDTVIDDLSDVTEKMHVWLRYIILFDFFELADKLEGKVYF